MDLRRVRKGAIQDRGAARRPFRGRITALAGVLLVAFSAREAVSAVSPLLGQISAALPFDAVATGILGMLPTPAFAVMGFFALLLLRRLQLDHLLLVAILLTTFGQVGGWNVLAFLVFTGIALLGIGLINVVAPPLLMKYFPDRGMGQEAAGSMLAFHSILALPVALNVPLAVVKISRPLPLAMLLVVAFAVGYVGIIFAPPSTAGVFGRHCRAGPRHVFLFLHRD